MIVVVDDAQWLDPESVAVLGFVARRLGDADPVGVLVATRDPGPDDGFAGLPARRVTGMSETETAALLEQRSRVPQHFSTVRQLVAATGGNPLAIVELAGASAQDTLAAQLTLADPVPITARLERHFLRQVLGLPADTRTLLLLAAADATRDVELLRRAAARFGLTLAAVDPASAADVFALDPTPAFRHPLIRSAVYRGADPADRRRVHHALAAVTDGGADPDRRAWHQAAASLGPDGIVADRLERAAQRAGQRGGWSMQAAFLRRAAELSPARPDRSRRLLAAAQAHLVADELPAAHRHLRDALDELRDPRLLVHAQRLRATTEIVSVNPAAAPAVLLRAIRDVRDTDPDLAWDMAFEALGAALLAGRYTQDTSPHEVAAAVLVLPPRHGERRTADLLVMALSTRLVEGHPAAVPLLRRAVDAVIEDPDPSEMSVPLAILGATAAAELWDDAGRRTLLGHLIAHDRRRGAVNALRVTLELAAAGRIWAGDFDGATVDLAESESLYRARGSVDDVSHRTELLAWQGDAPAVRDAAGVMIGEWGPALRIGAMEQFGHLVRTISENSEGHYADALPSATQLLASDPLGLTAQALPEIVETATRVGDVDTAGVALARLEERARASGTPWALGLLARCQALTAGRVAEAGYRDALHLLARTEICTEVARTHLLFGEWLRRHHRPTEARAELHTAHDLFTTMGAAGFARRARRELVAAGARLAPTPPTAAPALLTPQETQISELAALGATNREIASQLFLSEGTIEYHLTKVFRKLSVTSRRQLRRRLAPEPIDH